MAVSHIEMSQMAGLDQGNPPEFWGAPVGIYSIILSAAEVGSTTNVTSDSIDAFSANINLTPSPGADPLITFPVVQGMGFATAEYNGAQPYVESGVFFSNLTYVGPVNGGIYKYSIQLYDQTTWLMYDISVHCSKNLVLIVAGTSLQPGAKAHRRSNSTMLPELRVPPISMAPFRSQRTRPAPVVNRSTTRPLVHMRLMLLFAAALKKMESLEPIALNGQRRV